MMLDRFNRGPEQRPRLKAALKSLFPDDLKVSVVKNAGQVVFMIHGNAKPLELLSQHTPILSPLPSPAFSFGGSVLLRHWQAARL